MLSCQKNRNVICNITNINESTKFKLILGQFIFARASIAQNKHDIAVEMLEKLLMFDSGNPFIFELIAQSYFASNNREEALRYVNQAKILAAKASLEPFYREEPRNNLWPQGDQWVFLFEKVFRRYDPEAKEYCEQEWHDFLARLERY